MVSAIGKSSLLIGRLPEIQLAVLSVVVWSRTRRGERLACNGHCRAMARRAVYLYSFASFLLSVAVAITTLLEARVYLHEISESFTFSIIT